MSEKKTRTCHVDGTATDGACPACVAWFATRPNAETMTGDERAAEFRDRWLGILEVPFLMLHQRIEELVGRSVWTHELAMPDLLVEEARTRQHITMEEIVGKVTTVNPNAEVLMVRADEPSSGESVAP